MNDIPPEKLSLEDILSGKSEVKPETAQPKPPEAPHVIFVESGKKVYLHTKADAQPEYKPGETTLTGGTIYHDDEHIFADEPDETILDLYAPPPPSAYDLKTAGIMSYVLPFLGPFLILHAVNHEDYPLRFHALQALCVQLSSVVICGALFLIAKAATNAVGFLKFIGVLFNLVGFGLLGIFLLAGLILAGAIYADRPMRIPGLSNFIESQIHS